MITVAITRGIDPSTRGCTRCTVTVSTVHCSYSETAKISQVQPNRAFNGIGPRPAAPAGARSVSSPPRLRTAATTKPRRSMSSPATGRTAVARSARPAGDRPHHRRRPGHASAQQACWLCISSSKASVSKAELGTLRRRATSSRTTFVKRTSRSRRGVVTRRSPRGFTPCSTPSSSSSTAPMPNSLCSYHIFCVVICDMRGYNP